MLAGRRRRSLTFRLVSWYCGLLFAVGAAFAAFSYFSFDSYVTQTIRSTVAGRADAIWGMAGSLLDDRRALATLMEQRFAPEALNRMIRISSGGEVYYVSGLPSDGAFDPTKIERLPAGTQKRFIHSGDLFLYQRTYKAADGRTVEVESGQAGDLMTVVERRLGASVFIGLPILLIIAAVGGYVLVQRALSPVQAMIEAAEALTFNSPSKRLPLAGTEDRTDALGRFGTRLEQRFTASQIRAMMERAGLERVEFSPGAPYWCAVGVRAGSGGAASVL